MAQTLHERLKVAAGERTYRELAAMTSTSAETVRRYMLGQSPSAEFLSSLCAQTGVNGEWLLTGRGPVHRREIRTHALREANVTELLSAMSATLETLIVRVERLELFLQTMEARLRADGHPHVHPQPPAASHHTHAAPAPHGAKGPTHAPPPATDPAPRAQSITESITRRPPPDAG
ncbi:MAG TPA: hypothetical protein VD997_11570 [Phycisphaerales bacterium]|nr:hypothetical protein [Phycisphaerales bacterium]